MKQTKSTKISNIKRDWHLVDLKGKILGRIASDIALLLMGKNKPNFVRNLDMGDFVVVINAKDFKVTGNKEKLKKYYRHSGYPGGIKGLPLKDLLVKSPCVVLEKAVKGMLPKGPLGRSMMRKMKVYAGAEHPHSAQKPKRIEVDFKHEDKS